MKNNLKIVYLAGFLFAIPVAITSYINSSFLETYLSKYYIGIVYAIASFITILGLMAMQKILTHLGNRFATLLFGSLSFIALLLLAFGKQDYVVIPAFILFFVSINFVMTTLDIFVEDFSKSTAIGKLRGIYLMIINSAWVISQMISGSIIERSSFKGIYIFGALFMLLMCIVFVFFLQNFKDPKYIKISVLKTIKFFLQNKNMARIYAINLILKFFFAWMIIYTPIYLHEYLNFHWGEIGIIFTIMLLPFVILSFPLGKLSDKMGEKEMLLIGFFISAVATLVIPFVKEPKLLTWALILFITRIGAATIEIMSESYFFKSINEENAEAISFFRNTTPLAYLVAPMLAIPILLLVPSFEYLFFVLGSLLFYGLFVTLRLRDVK